MTTGILALILGLALGIGLAFIRERMDERIGGREGLEGALDAPVLAVIPHVPNWRNKKETRVVTLSAPDSPASEAYRAARTNLMYLAQEGNLSVIAVTGPGQGEGKTTTTVNLAVALAQAGRHVVAVSCDLRKPRLHRFFRLGNEVGLSTVLYGQVGLTEALKPTEVEGLSIIASGPIPHNPGELLGAERIGSVLDELRMKFDLVLLDTPPALMVADAIALAPHTDGVLVVANASKTARAAVSQLRHQFERMGGRILGGVLNNLDPKTARRYPDYPRPYYRGNYRYGESSGGRAAADGNGQAVPGPGAPIPATHSEKTSPPRPDPTLPDSGMWR